MQFKKWLVKELSNLVALEPDSPETDFAEDVKRDRKFKNPKSWSELRIYLMLRNGAAAVEAAKSCFEKWEKFGKSNKLKPTDGLGPKEIKRIRQVLRQAWQYCHARKLCVKRCTRDDGFTYCEVCGRITPKLKVDHLRACGDVTDGGYINRLYCPSSQLTGMCAKCHNEKTANEKKAKAAGAKAYEKYVDQLVAEKAPPRKKRIKSFL